MHDHLGTHPPQEPPRPPALPCLRQHRPRLQLGLRRRGADYARGGDDGLGYGTLSAIQGGADAAGPRPSKAEPLDRVAMAPDKERGNKAERDKE